MIDLSFEVSGHCDNTHLSYLSKFIECSMETLSSLCLMKRHRYSDAQNARE